MGGFSSIVGLSQSVANTLYDAINAATNAINGHKDETTGVHGAGASTLVNKTVADADYALKNQGARDILGVPRYKSTNDICDNITEESRTSGVFGELTTLLYTFTKTSVRTFVKFSLDIWSLGGTTSYAYQTITDGTTTLTSETFSRDGAYTTFSYTEDLWSLDNGTITVKTFGRNGTADAAVKVKNLKANSQATEAMA